MRITFMRFGYVELFSQNLHEAAAWWEEAMGAIIISDRGDQIWLALGETELLIRYDEASPKEGMRLVLYSDDVNDERERLDAGKAKVKDLDEEESFMVQDRDGRWHTVLEQPA